MWKCSCSRRKTRILRSGMCPLRAPGDMQRRPLPTRFHSGLWYRAAVDPATCSWDGDNHMELRRRDPAAGRHLLMPCSHSGVHPLEWLKHKVSGWITFRHGDGGNFAASASLFQCVVIYADKTGDVQPLSSKSWHSSNISDEELKQFIGNSWQKNDVQVPASPALLSLSIQLCDYWSKGLYVLWQKNCENNPSQDTFFKLLV